MTQTQQTLLRIDDRACSDDVFGGSTYNAEQDRQRLSGALRCVRELMSDGEWHTIVEAARKCRCSQNGAAARIRDLRKERFGGHKVVPRRIGPGLYEYRLIINH